MPESKLPKLKATELAAAVKLSAKRAPLQVICASLIVGFAGLMALSPSADGQQPPSEEKQAPPDGDDAGEPDHHPCELRSKQDFEAVVSASRIVTASHAGEPIVAPVLAGGVRTDVVVSKPYQSGLRACGVLVWVAGQEAFDQWIKDKTSAAKTGLPCKKGSAVCVPIRHVSVASDPDAPEQLHLRFEMPERSPGGWWPLARSEAQLYVAAYASSDQAGAEPPLLFGAKETADISGRTSSMVWGLGSLVLLVLLLPASVTKKGPDGWFAQWWQLVRNPVLLTAGVTGRASLSRLQLYGFTLLIASLVIYTWSRTGVLLNLSNDVLLLLGLSAAGAGGAKYTTIRRKRLSAKVRVYLGEKKWTTPEPEYAKLSDLIGTDGQLNVYKTQMAVFSVIVASVLASAALLDMGTITIPATYLALMGMGQGIYVAGKAISESDAKEFEDTIVAMQKAEADYLDETRKPQPDTAKVASKLTAYESAAKAAREAYKELYGVEVGDAKARPMES